LFLLVLFYCSFYVFSFFSKGDGINVFHLMLVNVECYFKSKGLATKTIPTTYLVVESFNNKFL
jgi:hypothetical protein